MLIEFRVENHRSLRDEQVLTMEAGRGGDENDPRPRTVAGHSERLLCAAALYGANASGKSNLLSALAFMRLAVYASHRYWEPDGGVPRDPFAWGPKRLEPSLFEVTFLLDAVRYQYGFVASDERILEEWLYAWPHGKKQVWFEREEDAFKFGEKLIGENRLIESATGPNALFLSTAVQLRHPQLREVYGWFPRLNFFNVLERTGYHRLINLLTTDVRDWHSVGLWIDHLLNEGTEARFLQLVRGLLERADTGIADLRIDPEVQQSSDRFPSIQLKHSGELEASWLPIEKESKGTQALLRLALPVLSAIENGSILVVDELEASLHPSLAREIVQQFNDPATNPRGAQIIFTTHDTNLLGSTLGEPALRRDQVWFTEKDPQGATVVYPLTDYKPRKAENLERGYLQGRYGAIPFLGDFTLAAE